MPCYTVQPLDRAQTTSQVFRDHGINNGAPASMSYMEITLLSGELSPESFGIRPTLPVFTAMYMKGLKEFNATKFINALVGTERATEFLPRPPLVITTGSKSEDHLQRITNLGFLPQSTQRYNYYTGPATDETIRTLAGMGVAVGCFSPYGSANVLGHLTLSTMQRVVYAASRFLGNWSYQWPKMKPGSDNVMLIPEGDLSPFITKEEHLEENGVFFPYFDGLVLPDKHRTPSFFCETFQQVLGDDPRAASATIKTIFDGWSSLNTTPAGIQLSHLMLGLDLAIGGRIRFKPVVSSRTYKGFVLFGKKFKVHMGPEIVDPYPKAELAKEINKMDQHALSLIEIALILSDIPLDGGEEKKAVTDAQITNSRILHDMFRLRTFTPETQEQLRTLANKLAFVEKFWEPADNLKLSVATGYMVRREFLPEDAPFALKAGGVMFTKDPILSTLAAFGIRAPTLSIREGGNHSFMADKPDCYKKVAKCNLKGVPYYLYPLQQAFEIWQQTLKMKTITIKQAGNDKNGNAKLPGVYGIVPFDKAPGKDIITALVSLRGEGGEEKKGKKRAAEQDGVEGPRKRNKKEGVLGMLPAAAEDGGQAAAQTEGDNDMDDFW